MSITDELREWAEDNTLRDRVLTTCPPQHAVHGVLETLLRIADHIDAEHERAMAAAALIAGVPITDEDMAKHGWVRLPKDADGVPIRVGDVLDGYGKAIEVVEMRHGRSGWLLISSDGNGYDDTFAFTHHHEPTVEDVLREFAEKVIDSQIPSVHPTYEEAIAEFAAKLRLVGDAE